MNTRKDRVQEFEKEIQNGESILIRTIIDADFATVYDGCLRRTFTVKDMCSLTWFARAYGDMHSGQN